MTNKPIEMKISLRECSIPISILEEMLLDNRATKNDIKEIKQELLERRGF